METAEKYSKLKLASDIKFDNDLIFLTERDPSGRLLMERLSILIETRKDWSEDESSLVLDSLELMYEAHGHDDRGNGDAYVTHPLRVALTLCANYASAKLVAAALLHDSVEDAPRAVIQYLTSEATETTPTEAAELTACTNQILASNTPRGSLIEYGLLLMRYSPRYASVASLVDGVTNRAYPSGIDGMSDPHERKQAKHVFRADQIQRHIDSSEEEAILKFADTYDNIRSLARHEAYNSKPGDIEFSRKLRSLEKLLDKYTLMINTWKNLGIRRPAVISSDYIAVCEKRLQIIASSKPIRERRRSLAHTVLAELERDAA